MASPDGNGQGDGGDLHRFGSIHTILKLDTLGKYLPAYTTALKNAPFKLHYIDAFAGTGVCHIKVGGERLMVPGSASIAIACIPRFHRMMFVEMSMRRFRALQRLKDRTPDRDIVVVRGDANLELPSYLSQMDRRSDRAIVFLDPYGMQLDWKTLRVVAESQICDAWYLFPLSGLYRQATLDADAIDEDKAASLTRILGTEEWRQAFYEQPRQSDMFGDKQSDVRKLNVQGMLCWVKQRLETIFPAVLAPKLLHQTKGGGKQGAPLFALFFAVSNPAANARTLALRIAEGVLRS